MLIMLEIKTIEGQQQPTCSSLMDVPPPSSATLNPSPKPLKLSIGSNNGAQPCQYQTIIAEYAANGSASQASLAKSAKPIEVRRIFTMGLSFTSQHAGQILFGLEDGYLYLMMGDGGGPDSGGDPYNYSQNKKSLLGKIMRFDVDNMPNAEEIDKLGLWGNYSIPKDNPFREDSELQPEIWALGMRNPWRCSFDSEKPSYFICVDTYEEVDLITKGGNYGWSLYEGPYPYKTPQSPGGTRLASIYAYIKSPIKCESIPRSTLPGLGFVYSFSEDNKKDVFILASNGVYRVVRPSRCNYTCSKENVTASVTLGLASSPGSSHASQLNNPFSIILGLSFFSGFYYYSRLLYILLLC
ncbi:hypothetical protein UlMin_023974 [Ulmus minor]